MKKSSLKKTKEYIYNTLDFSMMEKKMRSDQYLGDKWGKRDLQIAINLYKNFLYLQAKHYQQETIVPSEEIDEIWHNHILDTKKYMKDCRYIFGEYLHHYPYFGADEKSDLNDLNTSFERSQALYFKEFGEYY